MDILAIVIVIVAYFLESAFWMWILCFVLVLTLGYVLEKRKCIDDYEECDSSRKWQRNMLCVLLIVGVCASGFFASHNAKKNRIAEIKEVCSTVKY